MSSEDGTACSAGVVEPVVPISALEHHAYCPRQCALIHVDGVWNDSADTVRGTARHARVDSAADRTERGSKVLRHLPLWSERHGLSGRADAVIIASDGEIAPVEYKIGSPHRGAADLQVCAQAICLEEMFGVPVKVGWIWYSAARHRTKVDLGPELRHRVLTAIDEIRGWLLSSVLPPAAADERCPSCQLLDHCQPELSSDPDRVLRYLAQELKCDS
ncbi:MAG: CRISPR-associated protein Cas4 [Candidatus Dormibacteria bacterium]